jgi:hypothetical protein
VGLQDLYNCLLPTGQNIFHSVVPLDGLKMILFYSKVMKLTIRFFPDYKGITPLHLCIRDSQY